MKLYLTREEPVQEIATHPDTLAQLVAVLTKAAPDPAPSRSGSGLGPLIGLPLVLRPSPRPASVTS
jgi:hypothetical protein